MFLFRFPEESLTCPTKVSANNLQTSLSVHSLAYTSTLAHYSITSHPTEKATSTLEPWTLSNCYCVYKAKSQSISQALLEY